MSSIVHIVKVDSSQSLPHECLINFILVWQTLEYEKISYSMRLYWMQGSKGVPTKKFAQ